MLQHKSCALCLLIKSFQRLQADICVYFTATLFQFELRSSFLRWQYFLTVLEKATHQENWGHECPIPTQCL